MIKDIIFFIATNEYVIAAASLCSFISLWLTLRVAKAVKLSTERSFYNKNARHFRDRFSGFKKYLHDESLNSQLQSEIYEEIIRIEKQCGSIFSIKDNISIFRLKRLTKKPASKVDKHTLIIQLSYWIGRFDKKEE